jgi:putative flippase GtrA
MSTPPIRGQPRLPDEGNLRMILYLSDFMGRFGVKPREAERFIKFLVVGTVGFVVDFGTLTTLVEVFGVQPLVANVFSFSAAVVSNFIFNRYWTYPDSRSKPLIAQLRQFTVVSVFGLLTNTAIFWVAKLAFNPILDGSGVAVLEGRGYIPAKMVATVVVLFWNFFVNRYWTYNDVD